MSEKEIITADSIGDEEYVLQDLNRKDEVAFTFQERKHPHWNENYLLYRDKVITNRITQRQAVNIPLLKETIRTEISKTDEEPMLAFENLSKGNDEKRKEILVNEMWQDHYEDQHLDIVDNVDKKIHGLQGRSFKKMMWNWGEGKLTTKPLDPFDVLIDPKVNPLDLETAGFVILKNIFRPLRWILAHPKFREEGKRKLVKYLDTKDGLIAAASNEQEKIARESRLSTLGVTNFDDFGAHDVVVELRENFIDVWHDKENKFIRHLRVTADKSALLLDVPLKQAIGIDELPLITWAEDVDINDIWNDGKADSVRTINKVINVFISQLLENRTYRNLGMYFFNSADGRFTPGTFTPRPFGMYPVPGNPNDIMKQVQIQPIEDTINEINFLIGLAEKATATTQTDKGISEKKGTTLGEIQLDLAQSQKISSTSSKYYRAAWKDYGEKWYAINEANSSKKTKLQKKGADGEYYQKDISKKDWASKDGYACRVTLKSEKDAKNTLELQKLSFVKAEFMNNTEAEKIVKRKTLEILDWDPEDITAVMQGEEQSTAAIAQGDPNNPANPANSANPAPAAPQNGAPPQQSTMAPPSPIIQNVSPALKPAGSHKYAIPGALRK